jgi:hypothetical protein
MSQVTRAGSLAQLPDEWMMDTEDEEAVKLLLSAGCSNDLERNYTQAILERNKRHS